MERKLEQGPLASICANSALLIGNTSKLNRVLGMVFYWLLMASGLSGALLVLLDFLAFFRSDRLIKNSHSE